MDGAVLALELIDKALTGDPGIDAYHQQFYELSMQLLWLLQYDPQASELGDALIKLRAHAHLHFEAEERLMVRTGYPKLLAHSDDHARIIREHLSPAEAPIGKSSPFQPKIHEALEYWLWVHIQRHDLPLAEFVRAERRRTQLVH